MMATPDEVQSALEAALGRGVTPDTSPVVADAIANDDLTDTEWIKTKAAASVGLPPEAAFRLRGDTVADIVDDAKALHAALTKAHANHAPDPFEVESTADDPVPQSEGDAIAQRAIAHRDRLRDLGLIDNPDIGR